MSKFKVQYLGLKRPGWFRKKVPTWAIMEKYETWSWATGEPDCHDSLRIVSEHLSVDSAAQELQRYQLNP
jgi:hypothetical protein